MFASPISLDEIRRLDEGLEDYVEHRNQLLRSYTARPLDMIKKAGPINAPESVARVRKKNRAYQSHVAKLARSLRDDP